MPWTYSDLTLLTGGPAAVSGPFAYVFQVPGTQHVDYAAADGHIHELWQDSSGWHHIDLTDTTGAPELCGSRTSAPTGYVFASQGTQHVVFIADQGATEGHVHELWRNNTGWHHHDLTRAAGAPLALPGQPCGYAFEWQKTQHVDYIGSDGHLHELWWNSSGWHHHDLTRATGAPVPKTNAAPVGYAMSSRHTQHVHYISEDGAVHELIWFNGKWRHNDLTTWTGGPLAKSLSLAAYARDAERTQYVSYIGDDGDVHELWAVSGQVTLWRHVNLSAASGTPGPGFTGGFVCAYVFAGTRHVMYVSGDGHVHELWGGDNEWHYNDLSLAAGTPGADFARVAGYAAADTQHVDFIDIRDLHVYELRWQRRRPPIDVPPLAEPIV